MKKIVVFFISLLSISSFAAGNNPNTSTSAIGNVNAQCAHAVPTSDSRFCSSFKAVAYCHCHDEHGMPPSACSNMGFIYRSMIDMYHSLPNACSTQVQHDTSQQECIDDWNFYNSHC